jgi:hypothetical protein
VIPLAMVLHAVHSKSLTTTLMTHSLSTWLLQMLSETTCNVMIWKHSSLSYLIWNYSLLDTKLSNNLPLTCYPSYSTILHITEPKEHAIKNRKKNKQWIFFVSNPPSQRNQILSIITQQQSQQITCYSQKASGLSPPSRTNPISSNPKSHTHPVKSKNT